jgi:ribosomal protein L29
LDKETERLVNEVKRELRALRVMVAESENPKLLKTYKKLRSTID